MTRLPATLLLLLALVGSALAQGAVPLPPGVAVADRTAIQGVIAHQLDAFRHDDGPGAYQYAAPNIQEMFPSAAGFLAMVRRAYPQVYRPRDTQFSDLAVRDGQIVQQVELVGPDGQAVTALYTMVRDGHGHWLIAGCALVPSSRVST